MDTNLQIITELDNAAERGREWLEEIGVISLDCSPQLLECQPAVLEYVIWRGGCQNGRWDR